MRPYLLMRLWWNGLHWSTQTMIVSGYYFVCLAFLAAS